MIKNWLFLFFCLAPTIGFAADEPNAPTPNLIPCDEATGDFSPGEPSTYQLAFTEMKGYFPDLDRIEIIETPPQTYAHRLEVYLIRNGKSERLVESNVEYSLKNGGTTMHFSLNAGKFREARLGTLLMQEAAKRNPLVTTIEHTMQDLNYANFACSMATGGTFEQVKRIGSRFLTDPLASNNTESLLRDVVKGLKKGSSAVRFRQRMIDAFWEHTPGGRVDRSMGFRRLNHITLRLPKKVDVPPGESPPEILYNPGQIDASVSQGPPLDSDQVRVEIEDPVGDKINIMRLMPDGTIVREKRTLETPGEMP